MVWNPYYRGDGQSREVALPDPPPWREFPATAERAAATFQAPPDLVEAVNAALALRRPLLITGLPGSGKSSVVDSIAAELGLGEVLRWHITSRSTLTDALYRYDALGRLDATRHGEADNIGRFIELGPLGAALLPGDAPRVLLIDEIDKSDIDLPSDLLNVLERGEFTITELARHATPKADIRSWGSRETATVHHGQVQCTTFPIIVMTSNGERDFPAPFLRRCVKFLMPAPDEHALAKIVRAHLGDEAADRAVDTIEAFARDLGNGSNLAVDQLLNAIFLVIDSDPGTQQRIKNLLLSPLSGT